MNLSAMRFQPPAIPGGIIIIVGGYGSGKSEVSINLARYLVTSQSETTGPVSIVDLDIVNPYFRSREAAKELEKLGVTSVNPSGGKFYADLPIILPEIKGTIERREGTVVLDVGGDDAGSRVLGSLANAFEGAEYEMLFVVNANRPFTATAEGCLKMMSEIETASRLQFTGIISNTHLLEETNEETILDGLRLSHRVSDETSLPVRFLSALENILDEIDPKLIDVPVLPLNRLLLKPWE